jgi:glycine betaine/proline transport system ATP-binding protein
MSAVYVTDRDRRIAGMITDRDAVKLVQKGENSLTGSLRPVSQSVKQDEVLINLFVPAVESPLPLAVTDDEERLVGVIPRVTLLAALGPGLNATGEITIQAQPMPTSVIDELLAEPATDADAAEREGVL